MEDVAKVESTLSLALLATGTVVNMHCKHTSARCDNRELLARNVRGMTVFIAHHSLSLKTALHTGRTLKSPHPQSALLELVEKLLE